MLITVEYKHITKQEFLDKLITRFVTHYPKVLFPDGSTPGMLSSVLDSGHSIVRRISERFDNLIAFETSFWGYGINTISVGDDKLSNWDVDEIPYAEPLNRHHNSDCHTFSLIIFTVEGQYLQYNLFHMDLVRNKLNSNEGVIDLRKHIMTIIKTRHKSEQFKEKIFIESVFDGLTNPLSFQIDSLFSENYALSTAEYYKKEIKRLAKENNKNVEDKLANQIHISGSSNSVVMGQNNVLLNESSNSNFIREMEISSNKKGFIGSIMKHPIWSSVIATTIVTVFTILFKKENVLFLLERLIDLFK